MMLNKTVFFGTAQLYWSAQALHLFWLIIFLAETIREGS